jgi:hypothetical protein
MFPPPTPSERRIRRERDERRRTMTTPQEVIETPDERPSPEALRAEMFRILDEVTTARAERAKILKAEFDALWSTLPATEGETVH